MDGDFNSNPLYTDPQQQVLNTLKPTDGVVNIADPIQLDIPDDELQKIVDKRIKDSKKFFEEKYDLSERREKNERYLFGRQLGQLEKDGKLKDYETRSNDNALYEIESSLKPLAMSKLPDTIVTPGGEDEERKESAKNLTLVIDDTNKKREQREIVGLAFKHLPVYFTAVLKARWNPEKGKGGDYEFIEINPKYIVASHTATSRNPDDMDIIAQIVPQQVQEVIMKFPGKKKEFLEALKLESASAGGDPTWKELATEVKIWEVWFDWYKKKKDPEEVEKNESIMEPGLQWEKVSGVLWMYEDVILDKMLDPNFDHVGEKKKFIYGVPGDESTKKEVQEQDLLMSALTGQEIPGVVEETVYHNYFERPHKPFFFFGYDQWGKVYLDETSRIEQNIRNQENLDDQNKTILDQIKTRVKHIWSKDSGLNKSDVQRLDMDNPRMDVVVDGDVSKVHKEIVPERPDAAQFNARGDTRARMLAIAGATAVTGKLQTDVATSNQIAREADFTRSDDLVEDTINPAYEWMARWQMQFIKLRYTDEHMKEILGAKGEMTYVRLRRDTISDGMEVMIKASSTDKLKAQRNAIDTAKLGPPYSNPLDFFRDMGMSDPEGRAERGLLLMADPSGSMYMTSVIMGLKDVPQMAGALNGPMGGAPAPMNQPNAMVPGAPPAPQQNPTPTDTTQVPASPPTGPPQGSPRGL